MGSVRNIKLVHGVGENDADYYVTHYECSNGHSKQIWSCPIYMTWKGMIGRCYSARKIEKYPTYRGCSVADSWLKFSSFRSWMISQDYCGKHLDKDLIVRGNKVYSAETCVFISPKLNTFLNELGAARGRWPIGVTQERSTKKFCALCRNPFSGKQEHLGVFASPYQAHEAWRRRKHEHACALAETETDERIVIALRSRYSEPYLCEGIQSWA